MTIVALLCGEVADALGGLRALGTLALPLPLALKVRRLVRILMPIAQDVELQRQQIVHRYTAKDEAGRPLANAQGNAIFLSAETERLCLAEIAELMKTPVEEVPTIQWSEFGPGFAKSLEQDSKGLTGFTGILLALGELFIDDSEVN